MKFASRDTAAIDITCLVTGLVTVNGTEDSSWKHGMVPVSVRMVTGIEAAVLLSNRFGSEGTSKSQGSTRENSILLLAICLSIHILDPK